MNVLGISCHYHDAAACLVREGRVASAAQEERFTRRKHSPEFPIQAINACLQHEDLTPLDLDYVCFYEKPYLKLARTITCHLGAYPFSFGNFIRSMPEWLSRRLTLPVDIEKDLSFPGKTLFVKHHLAHAASAFLVSPFDEAAILTADGLGEWATTCWGTGRGSDIRLEKELHYPDSLGLVYSAVTTWLGFEANSGEGKVMALAALGEPSFLDGFRRIVQVKEDGSMRVDGRYFDFIRGRRMYSGRFVREFGPPRVPGEEILDRHRDMAASLQRHVEEALLAMARHVHSLTKMKRLCMAGGVFLNCVGNTRILRETPFEEVFIQPAAGDSGGALGAAVSISHSLLKQPRVGAMTHAGLGPAYPASRIRRCLANSGLAYRELPEPELVKAVARLIADNRIVGWFQGRMEFGPRALGARSILASPCHPEMKDILNARVKHRESFRPFGVSILEEEAGEFFDLDAPSPFMLLVAQVRPEVQDRIPSALHVDGSSRLQTLTREENGRFYDVVREFREITGVPMIINTSFNDRGEPIVCTPEDAHACFARTGMDALVMGDCLAVREGSSAGPETG